MRWIADFRARIASLLFRTREERELDEELRFHLQMEEEASVRAGTERREARRRARIKLGGLEQTKEAFRNARGVRPLEDFHRDVRLAFRSFRRSPVFVLTAVLVLAIGVGASTAIFSAVRAVVLRPLPFSDPDELFALWESNPLNGRDQELAAPANYLDWKERIESFSDMEAYHGAPWQVTITGLERPRVLRALNVTGGFFEMLGVRPALGRTFTDAETWAEATWRAGETPLLLSARAWRDLFEGSRDAIGTPLTMNGGPARVIGVMPDGFGFPSDDVDLWITFGWTADSRSASWFRRDHRIRPVARLASGATPEEAAQELDAVAAQLEVEHPRVNRLMRAGMAPLHSFLVGDTRTPLLVLLGAVGLMLLIACANVGNLLLVRASGRRREIALRLALGAGPGRLVRQMLAESVALATLGGVVGMALGVAGTRMLERVQPDGLSRVESFPIDTHVVGFAIAATLVAAVLFGTFPALLAGPSGPRDALRGFSRRATGMGVPRAVGGLVAAEMALAVMLALGAGLLVRSITTLRQVDPGFDANGILAVTLNIPGARYRGPGPVIEFYDEVLARIRAYPGVVSVAAASTLPLRERGATTDFSIAGRPPDEYGTEAVRRLVTPGYFETMGVPILSGRAISEADDSDSERVALINESLARQYFPGEDPVGQRITTDRSPDANSGWRTIIGVVGDERQSTIAAPPHVEIIEPFVQNIDREMFVYARVADGAPTQFVPAIRTIVQEVDPELPLYGAVAMEDVVADSMALDRFLMLLLVAFAAVAMTLALVGVYGVTAQFARQRLPELGLRMALGASAANVARLTIGRTVVVVGVGLSLGLIGALMTTRVMAGLLYGVTPNDPVTFVAVITLLAAATLIASWLPVRRAAGADPASTLRGE